MKIAVLFDGVGGARLGLERAGHEAVGFELDPWKHHLGQFIGSGNVELADVRDVDLSGFDAVWASPPCQIRSSARTQGDPVSEYSVDLLQWSLDIETPVLWVENITVQGRHGNEWGKVWNAAQFLEEPIQNRNRVIGGRYEDPEVFHPYKRSFPNVCPSILASEYKGSRNDQRRASRFYGRRLTVEECAYHQGIEIPSEWYDVPDGFTPAGWRRQLYEGIGNAVPVYMAEAFGKVYA